MKILVCDRCSKPQPPKEIGMWFRVTITGGRTLDLYQSPYAPAAGNDLCPECMKAIAETEDWVMLP